MSKIEEFNWSKYDGNYKGGNRLISNPKIVGQSNKVRCYSYETYAQKMFDELTSQNNKIVKKDLVKGDCVSIIDIYNKKENKINIELLGGLSVEVDLEREKRFIQLFGYNTVNEFLEVLQDKRNVKQFLDQGLFAFILESQPSIKISLWQGHIKKTKDEFMEQIRYPSKAYIAKIKEANKGGFFVEVQGVDAFMPGSLAAPNKINDFQSYIGKEVIVMIEDFIKEMNSFIVSHKKYIDYILPKKLSELSLDKKYNGVITGTSKYGIFVEFEEMFTGLLHYSKMKEDTLKKFKERYYKAEDNIDFFISEITKDNRIILTEESREEKIQKLKEFLDQNNEKNLIGKVVAIMNFGIIVNVDGISGLIPTNEFKKNKIFFKNFIVGDEIEIKFKELNDDKIVFKLIK